MTSAKKISIASLVLIIIVTIVGIFNYVNAQLSFRQEVINKTAELNSQKLLEESLKYGKEFFGSSGVTETTTPGLFSGFDSINATGEIRQGDNSFIDEGIAQFVRIVDFTDATITAVAIKNSYGEDIYIRDLAVQNSGKVTTTVRFIVTTSTSAFIASNDDATINAATLMNISTAQNAFGATATGGSFATSSILNFLQFQGSDTGVINSELPILWKPDIYILVFATSTGAMGENWAITNSSNAFNGELYLKLERYD